MTNHLITTLTPLDTALVLVCDGLHPVAPVELSLAEAVGCVAAAMPPATHAVPARNIAALDGWALVSADLAGASSYSPVLLASAPAWVEAGDALPDGCDCVLEALSLENVGSLKQVVSEAIPGAGVRRTGEDVAAGSQPVAAGRCIRDVDVLVLRRSGRDTVAVHRPHAHVIDISAGSDPATADTIVAMTAAAGARVTRATAGRDMASIVAATKGVACDLLVTVGGTGSGKTDVTIAALASCGATLVHGLALQPGRTAAAGRIGAIPVVTLPGAPDQALAAWWAIGRPVLARLSGALPSKPVVLPLVRKIASQVGLADIALLRVTDAGWLPLAVGDCPLHALAQADGWLMIAAGSEGHPTGHSVGAWPLRES